mgnify:CR=1 FL=1
MNNNSSSFTTSPLVIFAAIIIILAGMMYASAIVAPFLLALFIAIILSQPVQWLVRKRVPLWLSIVLVLLGGIAVFVGMGEIIGSSLSSFRQDAPKYAASLNAMAASFFQWLQEQGFDLNQDQLGEMFDPGKVISMTAGILGQLGSLMGNTFLVFFIILFILLEDQSFAYKAKVLTRGPRESLAYLDQIGKSIRHYLSIKTLISIITGILIWVALMIIGVEYAIVWALIAFLLNYIPTIGSILAGIPAVLFALVQVGYGGALWTLGVYIALNTVIGNVVEPKMMGKGLGLSSLVVFLALVFWGFLLGTVGMFLSVPLTMALKIVLEQNEKTRWIAVLLGTQQEAKILMKEEEA